MQSIYETCASLRISRQTLYRWMDDLEIRPRRNPLYRRYSFLTEDQVAVLAEIHHRAIAHTPHERLRTLELQLEELRLRVAELEQQLSLFTGT